MKVLYVLANFPKLSESFILNELAALQAQGVDVEVVAFADPGDPHRRKGAEAIAVHYLPPPSSGGLLRRPRALLRALRLGGDLRRRSVASLRAAQLVSYVRSLPTPPTHLHAHFADGPAVVALLAARVLGLPCSLTAHSVDLFCNPDPGLLTMVLQGVDVVIVPAHSSKAHLISTHHLPPERIAVVRAVSDPQRYKPRKPLERPTSDSQQALFAARLVEKKGARFALEAMASLQRRLPRLRLLVIGDGPLEAALRAHVGELGIATAVEFLGAVPDAQLQQTLETSDVFVLPCINTADGDRDICPLTLQEAMLVGVPVIAGRAGATDELVIDGQSGRLVNGSDPAAIADAIANVLGDPAGTAAMVERARSYVRDEFDPAANARRLHQAWAAAAERHRSTR